MNKIKKIISYYKFHPPYNYLTTNNLQTPFLAIFSIQIDATNGELLKE